MLHLQQGDALHLTSFNFHSYLFLLIIVDFLILVLSIKFSSSIFRICNFCKKFLHFQKIFKKEKNSQFSRGNLPYKSIGRGVGTRVLNNINIYIYLSFLIKFSLFTKIYLFQYFHYIFLKHIFVFF